MLTIFFAWVLQTGKCRCDQGVCHLHTWDPIWPRPGEDRQFNPGGSGGYQHSPTRGESTEVPQDKGMNGSEG